MFKNMIRSVVLVCFIGNLQAIPCIKQDLAMAPNHKFLTNKICPVKKIGPDQCERNKDCNAHVDILGNLIIKNRHMIGSTAIGLGGTEAQSILVLKFKTTDENGVTPVAKVSLDLAGKGQGVSTKQPEQPDTFFDIFYSVQLYVTPTCMCKLSNEITLSCAGNNDVQITSSVVHGTNDPTDVLIKLLITSSDLTDITISGSLFYDVVSNGLEFVGCHIITPFGGTTTNTDICIP